VSDLVLLATREETCSIFIMLSVFLLLLAAVKRGFYFALYALVNIHQWLSS